MADNKSGSTGAIVSIIVVVVVMGMALYHFTGTDKTVVPVTNDSSATTTVTPKSE